jgi:hypothetical protein
MPDMFNASEPWTWLVAWLRERVRAGLWWLVPLALAISLAGGTRNWFVRALVTLFALVVFRLWDDLEDVEYDRVWHPERVLCRTASLSRANAVCAAGLAIATLLVAAVGWSWASFVAVLPIAFIASRLRRQTSCALRVIWAHVILLKIPALVIALAEQSVMQNIWERALGLYGFIGAYEVLHDAEARRSSWAPIVFFMDMGCLLWGLSTGMVREAGT